MDRQESVNEDGVDDLGVPVELPTWADSITELADCCHSTGRQGSTKSVKVIGVGGAGCNVVLAARASGVLEGAKLLPDFILVDLGNPVLARVTSRAVPGMRPIRALPLAPLGAARVMALRQRVTLKNLLTGADMVVLVTGLGGQFSGAVASIVVRMAREANVPTVVVVAITPFEYESVRQRKVPAAIKKLEHDADQILIVSNEELSEDLGDLDAASAIGMIDRRIAERIRGVLNNATELSV
ncbi:MAG: hypothetical protein NTV11_00800 [Rhodocyclales bacterium]|nr:hypothetical protein [Rhodocyclales bacterium]